MRLSIIVAVYNVEEYIEECIKSLININIQDMEIIIVNDESPDNSVNIIEKFTDNRIKILHRKNGGLSAARNTGLEVATGKYILFVDSDDYLVNQDSINNMLDLAERNNLDMVVGTGIHLWPDNTNTPMYRSKEVFQKSIISSKEYLRKSIPLNSYLDPVWLNIYKRSMLNTVRLRFKEGFFHEDIDFNMKALLSSDKIGILDTKHYMYRERNGSITKVGNRIKHSKDIIKILEELNVVFNDVNDIDTKNILIDWLLDRYISAIFLGRDYDKNFMKSLNKKVLKNKPILRKTKIKRILLLINPYLAYRIARIGMKRG